DGTAQVGASGAQAAAQVVHVVAIDQAIAVTVGGAKRSQLHEPAFSPLHPMWAMPSISTRISALAPLASDFTSTRVQAGKSPVKNSLRAFHTWALFSMLTTKMVILTMSFITPPAASIRSFSFWNTALD